MERVGASQVTEELRLIPNALKKLEELKEVLGRNVFYVKTSGSLQLPKSNINEHN